MKLNIGCRLGDSLPLASWRKSSKRTVSYKNWFHFFTLSSHSFAETDGKKGQFLWQFAACRQFQFFSGWADSFNILAKSWFHETARKIQSFQKTATKTALFTVSFSETGDKKKKKKPVSLLKLSEWISDFLPQIWNLLSSQK